MSQLLMDKGYDVYSVVRRSSVDNFTRINKLNKGEHFEVLYGDLTDTSGLLRIISEVKPQEIYNLAAQSDVRISFDIPEYTGDVDGLGTTRLLEAIRSLGMIDSCKFYQASTSELYGKVVETPQTETTPFYPRSPYGVAKLYSYWMVKNYREAYNMYACNGILFNHESPRRGSNFVTNKVVKGAVSIAKGLQTKLELGNMDSYRDWGHSKDYVRAMHAIVNHDVADEFIVATGETHSVRELCDTVFGKLGMNYEDYIVQNPKYMRPKELKYLKGDPSKAREVLGWKPDYTFDTMIDEMIDRWLAEL